MRPDFPFALSIRIEGCEHSIDTTGDRAYLPDMHFANAAECRCYADALLAAANYLDYCGRTDGTHKMDRSYR